MAANEDVGPMGIYKLHGFIIISARIASNMHHKNLHTLYLKPLYGRLAQPYLLVITIAVHSGKWFEIGYSINCCDIAEITGMPNLVNRFKKFFEAIIKDAMGI